MNLAISALLAIVVISTIFLGMSFRFASRESHFISLREEMMKADVVAIPDDSGRRGFEFVDFSSHLLNTSNVYFWLQECKDYRYPIEAIIARKCQLNLDDRDRIQREFGIRNIDVR